MTPNPACSIIVCMSTGSPRLVIRLPHVYKDALKRVSIVTDEDMSEITRPAVLKAIRDFLRLHGEEVPEDAA